MDAVSCRVFSLDFWRSGQVYTTVVIFEMVQLGVSGSFWAHFHVKGQLNRYTYIYIKKKTKKKQQWYKINMMSDLVSHKSMK